MPEPGRRFRGDPLTEIIPLVGTEASVFGTAWKGSPLGKRPIPAVPANRAADKGIFDSRCQKPPSWR